MIIIWGWSQDKIVFNINKFWFLPHETILHMTAYKGKIIFQRTNCVSEKVYQELRTKELNMGEWTNIIYYYSKITHIWR